MTTIPKQTTRNFMVGAFVSAFLAILITPLGAQQAKPKEAPGSGCVWKLSDGDNTVYLAGSVHLLREKDYPIPATYDLAYADSGKVIFEIDMAAMTSPEGALQMQQAGSYGPGDSLSKNITRKSFDRIIDYFKSRKDNPIAAQMSAQVIERFKPGMVFLLVSSIESQVLGARPDLGLEMQYFQKATKDQIPSGGLETIAYQMSRFDELTPEEIEALIVKTLDELGKMPEVIDDLIGGWRQGDIEALDKLLNEEMKDDQRLRDLLLIQRNKNWIPEIEKALKGSENVMFLVGAAHLIGEDSVIDLLRKKGYTVERVESGKAELKKAA